MLQCGLLERTRQHFLQRLPRGDIQQQPRCHQLSNLPVLRGGAFACPARGRPFASRAAGCPAPFPLNHSFPHLRAIAQGTYNPSTGSMSSAACQSCAADTYSVDGASSCMYSAISCPAGSYATAPSSCIACAAGTYNPNTGSNSSAACLSCAAGKFNPFLGSTSSAACRNNAESSGRSSSSSSSSTSLGALYVLVGLPMFIPYVWKRTVRGVVRWKWVPPFVIGLFVTLIRMLCCGCCCNCLKSFERIWGSEAVPCTNEYTRFSHLGLFCDTCTIDRGEDVEPAPPRRPLSSHIGPAPVLV